MLNLTESGPNRGPFSRVAKKGKTNAFKRNILILPVPTPQIIQNLGKALLFEAYCAQIPKGMT